MVCLGVVLTRCARIWARYASWSAGTGTCPPEKCAQVGAGAPPAPFVVAPAVLKVPLGRLLTALFGWMLVVRLCWWEVAVWVEFAISAC